MDSGARFDRLVSLQKEIETAESRLAELAAERKALDTERINGEDLRHTLAEFGAIWTSLTTLEQEQLIQLLVAKVGYDGRNCGLAPIFDTTG